MRGTRLILTAAVALSLLSPAGADARPWFGFNDNSTIRGDLTPNEDARLLAAAGATSARITIDWAGSEPTPGRLDLSAYDAVYRAWTGRGIRPLLIVMRAPRWAWSPWVLCLRGPCHYPPGRAHDGAWARFVGAVAERFPLAIGIEVWNEPNLRGFWASGADPARYTELLRLAHDAVKAVDPEMPVIGGALAPVMDDGTDSDSYGLRPFLRAMYAHGARGLMDGISIHPYPRGRPHGGVFEPIGYALEVRDAAADDVPLWLTEFGVSTSGGYDAIRQANVLGDLVGRLLRRPEVAGVYVHTLTDPRRRVVLGPEGGYGVISSTGLPKPAYCAISRTVGGTARCPAPVPAASALDGWEGEERLQATIEAALAYRRRTGEYRPGHRDGTRLCAQSPSGSASCVTIVHGGIWRWEW